MPKDLQDPFTDEGMELSLRTITNEGRRVDAVSAYVHPLLQDGKHPNLHVLCESKVNRVLFDQDKHAEGVEYTPNPEYQVIAPGTTQRPRFTVKARKLVVLSCGALGTPLVLERSGVGDRKVLKNASVPVIADVPGVGHDYQDHQLSFWPFKTSLRPDETLDALWGGRMTAEDAAANKLLYWNGCGVHGKFRPTDEEVAALGPALQQAWEQDFKSKPNKPFMLLASINA